MAGPRSSDATRIEHDGIGELALPAAALYGIHTERAVRNLSFSGRRLEHYPTYVTSLALVKQAAARANRDAGVLDDRVGSAIAAGCEALIGGAHRDQFPVDLLGGGGSIAINMNVNEVIANLANESLGGRRGDYDPVQPKLHVNASQSTADVCHTAARLAILKDWRGLHDALRDCVRALNDKADALQPIATISRTCLQDGAAVSLGELFRGFAATLERRVGALDRDVLTLREVNLSGTVIGSGAGAPAAYRQRVLARLNEIAGHPLELRANLYDAAQNIDDLAAVSAQLALLAEVLIKVAQDLRLLASGPGGGFGEIILPAVQEGSSFFPGKINPVIPETVLQCCYQVLACDRAVRLALERGELHLNIFEGLAATNLFDAMSMLANAVPVFVTLCVVGLTANEARCRELAARAYSLVNVRDRAARDQRAAVQVGARVFLRPPIAGDRAEFLAFVRASRRLYRNHVTPPATPEEFAAYLRRVRGARCVGWLVCRRADRRIAGVINLNEIVRGAFCSAYLGYYAVAEYAGRGHMTEALQLVLHQAFTKLRLHRLEANVQPGNVASLALVKRCGFRYEGFSPRYLKIAGRWRDHERWAITIDDWRTWRQSDRS